MTPSERRLTLMWVAFSDYTAYTADNVSTALASSHFNF